MNNLTNIIDTQITTENVKNIIDQYNFSQTQTLNLCGKVTNKKSCNFSHDMLISVVADNILSSVNDAITENSFFQDLNRHKREELVRKQPGPSAKLVMLLVNYLMG